MKNTMKLLTLALLLSPIGVLAHEGHVHDVPGMLKAQRGGRIMPALGGLLVELVVDKSTNNLKFFPMDKNYKLIKLSEVKFAATAQRRRVDKTPVDLKIDLHNDHFMANFDPKGRYPYNIDVKTTYKDQEDTMQFIVDRN